MTESSFDKQKPYKKETSFVGDETVKETAPNENETEKQAAPEPAPVEPQPNYLEKLQYLQAEFINYRKRIDKQKLEWQDDAVRNFLLQLLPVLDDFESYFRHHGAAADQGSGSGIRMIYDKFMAILRSAGLETVSTETTFDPEKHEAVHVEQNEDVPHGHILQVWQPGYYFKEKLLRPARVKVAESKVADNENGQ